MLTDLPFGKQFGSLDTNRSLYPAVLAELARVLRTGGLAAVLTSQSNRATMREALAGQAGRPSSWKVEHLRSFRLFVKMDACIYLLRRVEVEGGLDGGERGGKTKMGGLSGPFGWEDGSSWHEQWAKHRPALVPFGSASKERLEPMKSSCADLCSVSFLPWVVGCFRCREQIKWECAECRCC